MTPQDQPNPLKEMLERLWIEGYNRGYYNASHPKTSINPQLPDKLAEHVKAYFLDLIGEDELSASVPLGMPESTYNRLKGRDEFRAELREKLK